MRLLYLDIDTLLARPPRLLRLSTPATTPNIDALAAEGERFANVYASDVPCLPSRAAVMSGTFGIRNGVVNHGGSGAELRDEGARLRLRESISIRVVGWNLLLERMGQLRSISSFPFRCSATWWNHGFMESMNLMQGMGADVRLPGRAGCARLAGAHGAGATIGPPRSPVGPTHA